MSEMPAKSPEKWYFSHAFVVGAVLMVGPLALPLIWLNPRYKAWTKIWVSVAIVVFTYVFAVAMHEAFTRLIAYYKELGIVIQNS